ncbi:hypothetical protein FC07_GL000429 [Loigolactobacillus bifermentans DSM 20003]|uniref:Uncharacterized protein n=1 Tax=Loigolactobacillus bifermentans DSM 20003 TaxID=1423726 RepID=A0A0R1GQF5_9LACO|nr:hypothetical protein FC07_GL000429 [Loigolactobacillus bifermentans DSM 20003]
MVCWTINLLWLSLNSSAQIVNYFFILFNWSRLIFNRVTALVVFNLELVFV